METKKYISSPQPSKRTFTVLLGCTIEVEMIVSVLVENTSEAAEIGVEDGLDADLNDWELMDRASMVTVEKVTEGHDL